MATIQVRERHLLSRDAYADVADVIAGTAGREILPATAVTIASYWQSPGGTGSVLASFASGRPVDRDALLLDVHRTRMAHGYFGPSGEPFTRGHMSDRDRDALDCLSTFIIHHTAGTVERFRPDDGDDVTPEHVAITVDGETFHVRPDTAERVTAVVRNAIRDALPFELAYPDGFIGE